MDKYFFINKSCYICPTNFKQNLNMKKIILSVVAIMAFGFANAQDKKEGGAGLAKGDLVLSGNLGFSSLSGSNGTVDNKDAKASTFTLSPSAGYMMSDNLMIQGGLNVSSGSTNTGAVGAPDVKVSGFGVNAGATYYFTPANNFSLGLGGNIRYFSNNQKDAGVTATGAVTDLKTNTVGLDVPMTLHYFVSDNFAITSRWAGLGYSTTKSDAIGAEAVNSLGLNVTMSSISFGLLYKL